jgi:hypothetical protein
MATPRKEKPLPLRIKTLDHGGIQSAVEAAMHTLPLLYLDEDIISTRAEKYVSLFFDYCLAANTQPITKTEIERQLSKIKEQSAALLLILQMMRGGGSGGTTFPPAHNLRPAWISFATTDAWRNGKLSAVVE